MDSRLTLEALEVMVADSRRAAEEAAGVRSARRLTAPPAVQRPRGHAAGRAPFPPAAINLSSSRAQSDTVP